MALSDLLGELWDDLRGQRVRAALSLLSVAWGTLAVLLLMAFSFGFEDLFLERARGIGDGIAVAWPDRTTKSWRGFPAGRQLQIARDDVLALPALVPELAAASAEFTTAERVQAGHKVVRVPLSGVDPPFGAMRQVLPAPGGRFIDERDVALRRRVIFLGDALARSLFGAQDPVGKLLVLRDAPFTVIGVLQPKEQDSDYGGKDEQRAYVPATTFQALLGARFANYVVFRGRDPRRQAECSAGVVAALSQRLRFDPADTAALSVWDLAEQQRLLHYIFLGFHLMLGLSGGFTLLVGGVGIANLMNLMVRRRTPAIGLQLAVGARPAQILREWLLQSLVLVAAGALLGALAAALVIAAVEHSPVTTEVGHPRVSTGLALVAMALLALVGLVAGWPPAARASRLDPVAALRS